MWSDCLNVAKWKRRRKDERTRARARRREKCCLLFLLEEERTVGSSAQYIIQRVKERKRERERGHWLVRPVVQLYTLGRRWISFSRNNNHKRESERRQIVAPDGKQLSKRTHIWIDITMFYYLLLLCLFVVDSSRANSCVLLNNKLHKYNINLPTSELSNQPAARLCPSLTSTHCCPQAYEDRFQNASALELYHLFELSTINLYEPLLRLTNELNSESLLSSTKDSSLRSTRYLRHVDQPVAQWNASRPPTWLQQALSILSIIDR